MELVLDNSVTYAIALEGGGARGAYEIGVWRAFTETGIKFNAVSGTSVGALNGAMFAMGDVKTATSVWEDMEITKVIAPPEGNVEDLKKAVSGKLTFKEFKEMAPEFREVIRNKGFDVSPLREWLREVVKPDVIRAGGVRLFATTIDITDMKPVVAEVSALDDEGMYNMLMASAYHPTFRQEKLGGKNYADGGFIDSLPVYPLVDAGYKNIIAIHLPTIGPDRWYHASKDTSIFHIVTAENLGGLLNFDREQSVRDMKIGYMDGMRSLHGLKTKKYTDGELETLAWQD